MILEYLAFHDWQRKLVQNYIYVGKMKQKECLQEKKKKKKNPINLNAQIQHPCWLIFLVSTILLETE